MAEPGGTGPSGVNALQRVDGDLAGGVGRLALLGVGLHVRADLPVPAGARQRQLGLLLPVVEDVDLAVRGDDPHVVRGAEHVVRVDDRLGTAVVVLDHQLLALEADLQDVVAAVVDLRGHHLGLGAGHLRDRLADVEGVAAAGVGPGGLLAAVHLPQLRARVVTVLRGDAVAVGAEHHAVTRRVELEEVVGELLQRRVLDGVGAPLLAGRQGQVPVPEVDHVGRQPRVAPGGRRGGAESRTRDRRRGARERLDGGAGGRADGVAGDVGEAGGAPGVGVRGLLRLRTGGHAARGTARGGARAGGAGARRGAQDAAGRGGPGVVAAGRPGGAARRVVRLLAGSGAAVLVVVRVVVLLRVVLLRVVL